MGRRGRCHQVLDDLKVTICYWKLKGDALDHALFGKSEGGYGAVVK